MPRKPRKAASGKRAKTPAPSVEPTPAPNQVGRPSAYQEDFARQAALHCKLGAMDEDLALFFEVDVRTIHRWKHDHPEFRAAIKDGKIIADMAVAERLHSRACGFEWDEAQPIKVKHVTYENGKRASEVEKVEIVMVHKVVPPDPTSAIFWLKNRAKAHWRDKQDVEHGVTTELASLMKALDGKTRGIPLVDPMNETEPVRH